MRLDNYLVQKGFFESRNKAQDAIKNALILVNKKEITKPSFKVTNSDIVEIKEHKFYVSRAALKLEGYLKEYNLNVKDLIVLDVGSSTGGFSQILLENGAKEIDCVDVGSNQLHKTLRQNPKINLFENCDIRDFKSDKRYDLIVSDVSFISLLKIIDSINNLAKVGTKIVLLFKPQFEVGKNAKRNSKGVVIDKSEIVKAKKNFLEYTKRLNWRLLDTKESKVSGKDGNIEYFYTFIKDGFE